MVLPEQVFAAVPYTFAPLRSMRPQSWPSGTSDIELLRVEGVHGLRHLDGVLVGR